MGLWEFALKSYSARDVPEACLSLQAGANVDVCVLLFAAWAAKQGMELSADDGATGAAAVAEWHVQIVRPLRIVRVTLKTGPSPAPTDRTNALRERMKEVELLAERIELDFLEQFGRARWTLGPNMRMDGRVGVNLLRVVEQYGGKPANSTCLSALQRLEESLGVSGA
jgi:uncharacterized protein (TIGR02444 family)